MNSGEQHAIFAHLLKSALRLKVQFSNIYWELQQFYHNCAINLSFKQLIKIKIKLSVDNLSLFLNIHKPFVFGNSNICVSITIRN